jgi:hypothetical protein
MMWLVLFIALVLIAACPGQAASAGAPLQVWNFDSETPGTLPRDLAIGTLLDGRPAGGEPKPLPSPISMTFSSSA